MTIRLLDVHDQCMLLRLDQVHHSGSQLKSGACTAQMESSASHVVLAAYKHHCVVPYANISDEWLSLSSLSVIKGILRRDQS